jgi:hypothetical protein
MRKMIFMVAMAFAMSACSKDPTTLAATVLYTDLHDHTIHVNEMFQADINGDGLADFRVSGKLVGDPLLKTDYHQFYFTTIGNSHTPVNQQEETPLLENGRRIAGDECQDSPWYYAALVLTQKVIRDSTPEYWTGNWKKANHGFLALRIIKDGKNHYGWLEISVDQAKEGLIVHRAGFNLSPEQEIAAGL